jgi:hypothetical protein
MIKQNAIFPGAFNKVAIKWDKPVLLSEINKLGNKDQDKCFLYKIVGKNKKNPDDYRLIYIGMTEAQLVHYRLSNKDHQKKQAEMKKKHRGYELHCSVGEFIENYEKADLIYSLNNIKKIESLLIVAHSGDEYKLFNKKSKNWFSTEEWIFISNEGFLKDKMKKQISFGLFSS